MMFMRLKIFVLSALLLIIGVCSCTGASAQCGRAALYYALENDNNLMFAHRAVTHDGECIISGSYENERLYIRALCDTDGAQLTDELSIGAADSPYIGAEIVTDGKLEYLLIKRGAYSLDNSRDISIYALQNDSFTPVTLTAYKRVTRIGAFERGVFNACSNTRGAAYNLLNTLQAERLEKYRFRDVKNTLKADEERLLRLFLAAVADIMDYDYRSFDTDKLMSYILNTHRNFLPLYPHIPYDYGGIGEDGIGLAPEELISAVTSDIFALDAPKPPVNALSERGFCANNGYFYYTRAFNVHFATEIRDICAVYRLDGGALFVVFSDIYSESGVSVPEYSYAILRAENGRYLLLRLDMGALLPDENAVLECAQGGYGSYAWENDVQADGALEDAPDYRLTFILAAVLLAVSAGALLLWAYRRV